MSDPVLPQDLRFEEIATFLTVYERAKAARPLRYPTFRDLFHGLGAHTTTLGHLSRLLDAIFPTDLAGIPAQAGERLKLLFAERPGVGLEPTPLADRLHARFELLADFWKNLRVAAVTTATNWNPGTAVVRVGAPQTLTLRLLPYACSNVTAIFAGAPESVRLDITTGDTDRDLLPRLHLGTLDCIAGYGLPSQDLSDGKGVYTDPDDDAINFANLGSHFEMVLIYHPAEKDVLFETQKQGRTKRSAFLRGEEIDPAAIDLRRHTLIAVPSWRQCEGVQDMIDRSRRLGRLKEVETDDEALALVRCGCGIAIVSEVFQDRRVIKHARLTGPGRYVRQFGIYYSRHRGLTAHACRFAEFLREYMTVYEKVKKLARKEALKGKKEFKPPAFDEVDNPTFPNEVKLKYGAAADWDAISADLYPLAPYGYRPQAESDSTK